MDATRLLRVEGPISRANVDQDVTHRRCERSHAYDGRPPRQPRASRAFEDRPRRQEWNLSPHVPSQGPSSLTSTTSLSSSLLLLLLLLLLRTSMAATNRLRHVHVARPVGPSEISCFADQSESSSLLGRALLQPCCACCALARRICARQVGACRAAHGRGEREGSRLREGRGAAGRGTHETHAVRHEEAAGVPGTDRRRSDQVRPRSGRVSQELREAVIDAGGLRRQR